MKKRVFHYSEAPVHQWAPAWHRMIFRGIPRDYTASAVWFHLIGCAPVGLLCALLVGLKGWGNRTVAVGQMVSLVFGLMLVWWGVGILLIRPLPRLWTAPPLGRGRHAARYVFSAAMAMLTACGTVTAIHFVYQGLLGHTHGLLDALTAWGAVLGGQAAGCLTLRTSSRNQTHLTIGLIVLGVLALISLVSWLR
ncbi:MAG: hypothetical protein IJF65_05140 [Clostridia bacterium]|nr:hypothetical protein [Clostridia bacterium]